MKIKIPSTPELKMCYYKQLPVSSQFNGNNYQEIYGLIKEKIKEHRETKCYDVFQKLKKMYDIIAPLHYYWKNILEKKEINFQYKNLIFNFVDNVTNSIHVFGIDIYLGKNYEKLKISDEDIEEYSKQIGIY